MGYKRTWKGVKVLLYIAQKAKEKCDCRILNSSGSGTADG